jgi:predicted ATPase
MSSYQRWFLDASEEGSPIIFSTTVPLTIALPKSNLHEIEHRPTHQIGESLSK